MSNYNLLLSQQLLNKVLNYFLILIIFDPFVKLQCLKKQQLLVLNYSFLFF